MFLLLTSYLLFVASADVLVDDGVYQLTTKDFESFIAEHEYVMVEFYAPWCGHCKALAPKYKEAADILKTELPDVVMAAVDATVESDIASKFEVVGYPTMKFYKKGKWINYKGGHNSADLVKWITTKIGPSVMSLETNEELEAFKTSADVVVVGFMKTDDDETHKLLEDVSETLDTTPFAVVSSQELFEKNGITKSSLICVFKKFDEGRADYDGELNAEDLGKFVHVESIPAVTDFSEETAGTVFGSHIRLHYIAFARKSDDYEKIKDVLKPIAKKYKGKVHFILIDVDVESHENIMNFFGMTKNDVPDYRFVNLADDMVKFKPDSSDFSEQAVSKFVDEIIEGKRKPFLMSEDIPAESNEPVRVLVGLNYHDVTKDTSKAVFVKLYAPWCGHCKALAPVWEQLGEHHKGSSDVIIAKIDSTTNEAEALRVGSFPTLKFYPKGSSEAIDYAGERTLEAFKKFVDSNGEAVEKSKDGEEKDEKDEL